MQLEMRLFGLVGVSTTRRGAGGGLMDLTGTIHSGMRKMGIMETVVFVPGLVGITRNGMIGPALSQILSSASPSP